MSQKEEEIKTVTKFEILTTVPGFVTHAEIISALRAKYDGVVYDVSNPTGMAKAVFARKELRDARVALDKRKPEVKREALDFCAKVEADYKAIRSAVCEYEDIPDAAIKAEEERKEAIKAELAEKEAARKKVITDRIAAMSAYPGSARILSMDAAELEQEIATIEKKTFGTEYAEFLTDAQSAKDATVTALKERHDVLVVQAAEATAAELARIEREAAEAVERDRVKKEQEVEAARLEEIRTENDRLQVIRDEENRKEREELDRLRAEDDERRRVAAAAQAETDRIAAEELASQQAIIDAEKGRLAGIAAELEAAQLAEDQRKAEAEAAKVKPLASGYSIVLKNAGKGRWVGLWIDEKDEHQYRTAKVCETEEIALFMVKEHIADRGRV